MAALTGTEKLYVEGISANGQLSAQTFHTTTGAIAALAGAEEPVVPSLTAHSGGGQTSATLLTLGAFNNITTVAVSADSVKLPASYVGATATVSNQGANAAQIFGTSPDTINGVATGTGISIPVGAIFVFTCAVVGNWLQNVQTGGAFTGTFDGVLGGNTPAAASVTTLAASSTASATTVTATAATNQVILGTTRTLTLTSPIPATSSRTLTLPDPGGADSVAYLALAQTLTNKTLTAPVIHVPPLAAGASTTLTAVSAGKTILLNTAAGSVVTLPAATGTGDVYKFVTTVTTTTTTGHKILAVGTDYLIGMVNGVRTTAITPFLALVGSTFQSLQMPFTGSQPSGGIQGDWFEITDVASGLWEVKGQFSAGTTATTPFSTATS